MASVAILSAPTRHPWLAALIARPAMELRALLEGYADVAPYGRAEPADAAVSLLHGVAGDDPARIAFDQACGETLAILRGDLSRASGEEYEHLALILDRLLTVIGRVRPRQTIADLHARYPYWFRMVEAATIDDGLDVRREFWRLLALTQDAAGLSAQPRRLMPLWLELCAEAGPLGLYDESYLDVGLIGLRRLPLGPADSSTEEAVCHGIARWAARQQPGKLVFLSRWREIESAYPRSPDYWPDLVADVIAATEAYLSQATERRTSGFPAAAWWRDELDLLPRRAGEVAAASGRRRVIEPPARELHEAVVRDIAQATRVLVPRIDRLMQAHRRYADATGDTYYLVRTACNIGMQLIRQADEQTTRGACAAGLARLALDYAPHNVFAWALWRDALAVQGNIRDAELIGWEALRRYPEDPQWRNQLAGLLEEKAGRPEEAERLLHETTLLFPLNGVARVHRAKILSDRLSRHQDADDALRQTIETIPDHVYAYNERAVLRARHFNDGAGARDILRQARERGVENEATRSILRQLDSGRPFRPRAATVVSVLDPGAAAPSLGFDTTPALLRRALFRYEHMGGAMHDAASAEIRQYSGDGATSAYARYAAQRVGIQNSNGYPDAAFAFAFEQARQARDVAAFIALTRMAHGMDVHLLGAAIALAQANPVMPPAPARATDEPEAFAIRFGSVVAVIATARPYQTDPAPYLVLLSDFSASRLSTSGMMAA